MYIYYQRKTSRLKDYDYSQDGMYYITICTKDRKNILSKIEMNKEICRGRVPPLPSDNNNLIDETIIITKYSAIGEVIKNTIDNFNKIINIKIRNYVIMPNHIHFIIELENYNIKGRGGTLPLQTIIGRFKSFTTKQYNFLNKTAGMKLWQRNYFEHVIRNEKEYNEICEYIKNNPINYILNESKDY